MLVPMMRTALWLTIISGFSKRDTACEILLYLGDEVVLHSVIRHRSKTLIARQTGAEIIENTV